MDSAVIISISTLELSKFSTGRHGKISQPMKFLPTFPTANTVAMGITLPFFAGSGTSLLGIQLHPYWKFGSACAGESASIPSRASGIAVLEALQARIPTLGSGPGC